VLAGTRPVIPGCFYTGEHAGKFARYIDIVQKAWDQDPSSRPPIQWIAAELEDILFSGTCADVMKATDATLLGEEYNRHLLAQCRARSVAGDDASILSGAAAAAAGMGLAADGTRRSSYSWMTNGSLSGPPVRYPGGGAAGSGASMSGASTSAVAAAGGGAGAGGYPAPRVGGASMSGNSGSAGVNMTSLALEGGSQGSASIHSAAPPIQEESYAQRVLDNLRAEDDGAALLAMELSGACTVLVLPVPPHEIVYATRAWCLMSGCLLEDIVGTPLHSNAIFSRSAFVKVRGDPTRPGATGLSSELFDAPDRSTPSSFCSDLCGAAAALMGGGGGEDGNNPENSIAALENARATSLFFKSLNSRYLHRARSSHAIINVADFSCRTYNLMHASRKTTGVSLRQRLTAAVVSGAASTKGSGGKGNEGDSSGGGGGGGIGFFSSKKSAGSDAAGTNVVVNSTFSVHAFPVYQRTPVNYAPASAPSKQHQSNGKMKSGFFNSFR
jgi:hypothetical protein